MLTKHNRFRFIKKASINNLNIYFLKMEKLAIEKGGKYRTMYEEDKDFILNGLKLESKLPVQTGGLFDFLSKFFYGTTELEQNICFHYVKDEDCGRRSMRLNQVKVELEEMIKDGSYKDEKKIDVWKGYLDFFMGFFTCCNYYYFRKEREEEYKNFVLPILVLILSNKDMCEYAYDKLSIILLSQKNLQNKYFKEANDLLKDAIRKHSQPVDIFI